MTAGSPSPKKLSEIERVCPICQSPTFAPYRERPFCRCTGCGAKERERLLSLVIQRLLPEPTGARVIHFAPEPSISKLLHARFGDAYVAADISPEAYPWLPVEKIDLSSPSSFLPQESVQGLIHSHVLEHIPGDLTRIIRGLNDAVQAGGFHLFSVPFFTRFYREDLNELPPQIRDDMYGQNDHVRSFGTEDFDHRVLSLFEGFDRVPLGLSRHDLARAAVPVQAANELTSHSAFLFRKRPAFKAPAGTRAAA